MGPPYTGWPPSRFPNYGGAAMVWDERRSSRSHRYQGTQRFHVILTCIHRPQLRYGNILEGHVIAIQLSGGFGVEAAAGLFSFLN